MAYSAKKPKKKKRVTALQVHEISLVDKPAVPDAKILIAKRKKEGGIEDMPENDDKNLELEKREEEKEPKENPFDKVRGMVSEMMDFRRALPGPVRRTIMELDMLLDEMTRNADKQKEEEKEPEEEEDEKKKREHEELEEDEKKKQKEEEPEEDKEEKARQTGEDGGKRPKPKPEAAIPGFEKQVKPTDGKCPEGMRLDEEKGICIPIPKQKKSVEKSEDKDEELELTEEQTARIDKLLAGSVK